MAGSSHSRSQSSGVESRGKKLMALAALMLAAGVALGAFAAHGLKSRVSPDMLAVFRTAVDYHVWHSLGLLFIGLLIHLTRMRLMPCAILLVVGVILFSGSLYTLALTGMTQLGMITPLGGIALIAGWLWLAVQLLRGPAEDRN